VNEFRQYDRFNVRRSPDGPLCLAYIEKLTVTVNDNGISASAIVWIAGNDQQDCLSVGIYLLKQWADWASN
jgi:hypothetical protein